MAKGKIIVVDGSNVAYTELSEKGQPKVSNLVLVRQALQNLGYDPIIIVDASLRHQIDDPNQLESLLDNQTVRQAPAGTDADFFVLETADEYDARIVSNDEFAGRQAQYPWVKERRVPLMIVKGDPQFYGL